MHKPAMKRGRLIAAALAVIMVSAAVYVYVTWPYNFVGWITYRLSGKSLPSRATELENIKRFLDAKRKLGRKEYDAAFQQLQYLKHDVSLTFPFFREIYLYLGYIHDIRGDFSGEEALHNELETKDRVFARFLKGLYAIRHGKVTEGKGYLQEAVELDNRFNRLGKYRGVALKVLEQDKQGEKRD